MLNKQKNKLSSIVITISLFMASQAGLAGGFAPPENASPPGFEQQLNVAPTIESNIGEALDRSAAIAHPASDIGVVPSDSPTLVGADELSAMAGVQTDITSGIMTHEQGEIIDDSGLSPAEQNKPAASNKTGTTNG